jgi:hypothetical protein
MFRIAIATVTIFLQSSIVFIVDHAKLIDTYSIVVDSVYGDKSLFQ